MSEQITATIGEVSLTETKEAPKWSSRKFAAAMFWEAVFVLLLWHQKLPVEAFVSLTYLLLGGYFLGNLAQHWINKVKPT
jgi:hypothetical protein